MKPVSRRDQRLAFISFIGLLGAGIFALLFVWSSIFKPEDLETFPLPLVAVLAGVAATFNPCALPTLPAFLTRLSAKDNSPRKHLSNSFYAGLGALLVVLVLGLAVATLGEGLKPFVRENFRWVQLAIGLILITLAGLHKLDRTSRFPFRGPIIDIGHQIWEHVLRNPSPGGSLTFGAGFVLVGVG
jgi:cytochrome c biogenesis protein CcdA